MKRKCFRRLRKSFYGDPVVEGAAQTLCEPGHGGKLVDGGYQLCEVDSREHYVDKLSGKTLESGLCRGVRRFG